MSPSETPRPAATVAPGLAFLALALAACDLGVNDPDIVTPEDVADPASLPIATTGVVGDFQEALDSYVRYSGLFTDEFILAGTFPTRVEVDARAILVNNTTVTADVYEPIHVSRFSADRLVEVARGLLGDPDVDQGLVNRAIAIGQFYGGYARILLAEMYCQSILGGGDPDSPNYESAPVGPDARMEDALDLLQAAEASATAAGRVDLAAAARIGQARANMWLGNYGAVAVTVDPDFELTSEYSTNQPAQYNEVYTFTYGDTEAIRWTVGDGTQPERNFERFEFYDEFVGVDLIDPGPPDSFEAFNFPILVHLQMVYPPPLAPGQPHIPPAMEGQRAPILLATGYEAAIMAAEVRYRSGDVAGAEAAINALLTEGGNPHGKVFLPVDLTGDFEGDIRQIGYAYEAGMWLTGHRLGFVRRVLRNDGVDLFPPTQPGSDTAFPVVEQELDNNPDIGQACPSGPPWS